jgi:DNA end-binding protein Ku
MARAVWTGSLGFGLVNVEVGLYAATEDKMLKFNQFQFGTTDRIRYQKVNAITGTEVPTDNIIKGFDLGGNEVVFLTEDELATVDPEKAKTISIRTFVNEKEIDPLYYRKGYFLAPRGEGSKRAYALLRAGMQRTKRAAIGTMVMRDKEYLVSLHPADNEAMVLQTLYFADEVRSAKTEVPNLPQTQTFARGEVSLAVKLIDSLTSEWQPEQYHDTHRERIQELIAAKAAGKVMISTPTPPAPKIADLLQALEESVRVAAATKNDAPNEKVAKPANQRTRKAS